MSCMFETYYLGAYWGPRPDPLESCAERFSTCLRRLGLVHELFGGWSNTGYSRRTASRSVQTDPESLRDLLVAGRNRRDTDGGVIDELGFSASVWNGRSPSVGFMVTCGATSARVSNSSVLDLPEISPASQSLFEWSSAQAIITALVDAWQPDWATFSTRDLRKIQRGDPWTPVVGWMTYLGPGRPVPGAVPDGRILKLHDGHLVVVSEGPAEVKAETVLRVRESLSQAGSLNANR
jgi:hypothetical protein